MHETNTAPDRKELDRKGLANILGITLRRAVDSRLELDAIRVDVDRRLLGLFGIKFLGPIRVNLSRRSGYTINEIREKLQRAGIEEKIPAEDLVRKELRTNYWPHIEYYYLFRRLKGPGERESYRLKFIDNDFYGSDDID